MGDNGAYEGFLRSHTFSTFSGSAVTDLRSALPALFQRLVPGPLQPPEVFTHGAAGMSGSGRVFISLVESRKNLSAADKNEREEDKIKIRRLRITLRYFSKFTLSP